MRHAPLLLLGLLLGQAPAIAQDPTEFVSKTDYFSIAFPTTPAVEEITFPTEYRITLPGRVYTSEARGNRYRVTVVDYRNAVQIHQARNKKCEADALKGRTGLSPAEIRNIAGDQCQDDGPEDVRGAMMWATWNFVQKATKVTHLAHYNSDLVEGHEVHTINQDETRSYAIVHMHENRLYIAEALVPKGRPPANWFQVSIRFLDDQFKPVRYSWQGTMLYSNGYPKPSRTVPGTGGQPAPGQ